MNKLYQVYTFLILFSITASTTAAATTDTDTDTDTNTDTSSSSSPFPLEYAMTGCNDTCGTVTIPYPFGIGANCSVNKWYTVDCNSSTPYLSALNQLQILKVDLENQTVTVNTPMISDCSQTNSLDLGQSPFLISKSKNKFVFNGCGNAVMMDQGNNPVVGCSTTCGVNDTVSEKNNCHGVNCCETTIPHHLKSYTMNFTGGDRSSCKSAFLVDKDSYRKQRFSNNSYVPVSLRWTLSDRDRKNITCCSFENSLELDLGNGISVDSWKCIYVLDDIFGLIGNTYIETACGMPPAVEDPYCTKCRNNGGDCYKEPVYGVDGLLIKTESTCYVEYHGRKSSKGVILGVSISMGVLILVATTYALYKVIKKTKERRLKKRFFKQNGGLLLKQQVDPSLVDKTILFTSHELENATNNFNENRILGGGGQGTVYKGMLVDGRIVAIKKSKIVDESQMQQFINELVILSQVNHRNVVKLLGCCLETEVPLLVSEFIPNGTLYDHLHNETHEFLLSFNMRLQIATEVASAVAYLHSSTSIPIYHRDIKTTNILLDDKYRAKVSDFGTSRFISIDQTHLTTAVKGTIGYLDPEYFQSSQFTEKSDVYSFGVVLVELLTGERPISLTRFGESRSLATHFLLAMEEERVMSIFDATVLSDDTKDDLFALANLAMRCLNNNGKYRPTMTEVAIELETIRTSHIPAQDQSNITHMIYGEDLSIPKFGESSSTFLSFNNSFSQ